LAYFKREKGKNSRNFDFLDLYSSKPIFYLLLVQVEKFFYINFAIGYEPDMKMKKISFCYRYYYKPLKFSTK